MREKVGISHPSNDLERSALPELGPVAHVGPFLRALRPSQWAKNLLVLAAPLAAGVLLTAQALPREAVGIAAFCLVASAGYLLNDVTDIAADRAHPDKRRRPVASGALSPATAIIGAGALASGAGPLGCGAPGSSENRSIAASCVSISIDLR